ncbi:MAG TPA: hypothetical protein VN441_14830 [Syntrophomonas sp.]|nr:hypothetical protein [Syntrophomonas sp.]
MEYVSAGRFSNEKSRQMLRVLRQYVPHIHWDSAWSEGELGDSTPYSDIYVPEFQLDEAELIIDLYEKGEDLSGYRTGNKYPPLLEEVNGNFQVVGPLEVFAARVKEFIALAESFSGDDPGGYMRNLSRCLIGIYSLQFELPECASGFYYQPGINFKLPDRIAPFSAYYDVDDPFTGKVELRYWEKTLACIMEVLQTGINNCEMYNETGNYKYLSLAASIWKNQFYGENGWGTAAVNMLKVFHYVETYLQQGTLPAIFSGESNHNEDETSSK